jgi:hypothetical protein
MSKLSITDITLSNDKNSNVSLKRDILERVYGGGVTVEVCNPSKITQKPDGTIIIECK